MWVGCIFLIIIKFAARMRIYIIVCATLTQRQDNKTIFKVKWYTIAHIVTRTPTTCVT